MLVLYFKNDKASFQERRFSLEVISSKHVEQKGQSPQNCTVRQCVTSKNDLIQT